VTDATSNYSFAANATLGNAITANTLSFTGTGITVANNGYNITLNGLMCAGSGSLTISGTSNVVIGASKELVMFINQNSSTISSKIVDNPGGPSVLNINMSAVWTLSGANTYSGGTVISGNSGELSLGSISSAFWNRPGSGYLSHSRQSPDVFLRHIDE